MQNEAEQTQPPTKMIEDATRMPIAEYRKAAGMSQYLCAMRSGIPRMRLSLAETGQVPLSPEEDAAVRAAVLVYLRDRRDALRAYLSTNPQGMEPIPMENPCLHAESQDSTATYDVEWFSLTMLSQYASVSVRTLRKWIRRSVDPLPASQVEGKIRVRRGLFDQWMDSHRIKSVDVTPSSEKPNLETTGTVASGEVWRVA